MRQLVVLSGKGGTGKTSIAGALADLASRECAVVLVDADADAANLGLLLEHEPVDETPFRGSDVAFIDGELCLACGECHDVCRFGAVVPGEPFWILATACEGCGACLLECPSSAIQMEPVRAGAVLHARTGFGELFHGDLLPGQDNSGKLVAALRTAAAQRARQSGADLVLVDGPPGIGCPVLAACTGVDLALLVTEPSLSALQDLGRVFDTLDQFGIPAVACLNKCDLHAGLAARIRSFLRRRDAPLVGEVPHHPAMQDAVERGLPATAIGDEDLELILQRVWAGVREALAMSSVEEGVEAT